MGGVSIIHGWHEVLILRTPRQESAETRGFDAECWCLESAELTRRLVELQLLLLFVRLDRGLNIEYTWCSVIFFCGDTKAV